MNLLDVFIYSCSTPKQQLEKVKYETILPQWRLKIIVREKDRYIQGKSIRSDCSCIKCSQVLYCSLKCLKHKAYHIHHYIHCILGLHPVLSDSELCLCVRGCPSVKIGLAVEQIGPVYRLSHHNSIASPQSFAGAGLTATLVTWPATESHSMVPRLSLDALYSQAGVYKGCYSGHG